MIVIVAAYPAPDKQKDGMVQRVAYIDDLIKSVPRTYLDVSFRRFSKKKITVDGLVTIYQLNFFLNIPLIISLLKRSRLLYIHSASNALKTILFKTEAHVIYDAHGIVPEELLMMDKRLSALVYSFGERKVLDRCNTLVCVTRSMLEHFNRKYGEKRERESIVFPILPRLEGHNFQVQLGTAIRDERSVIYAGGAQVWQNVEKMLQAALAQPEMKYTILTTELEFFEGRIASCSVQNTLCCTVEPEQVKNFYLKHEYGFILRDAVLVNEVACPTKLMEYLYWGILPIVLTPRIGDFNSKNLCYVTLEDFQRGKFPDRAARVVMRERNRQAIDSILKSAQASVEHLKQIVARFT